MRTAGAELRGTARFRRRIRSVVAGDQFFHFRHIQFAIQENILLGFHFDAHGTDFFRQIFFAFFHHDGAFVALGELIDLGAGQGKGHAEFQDSRIRSGFRNMLIRSTRADDAQIGLFRPADHVQVAGLVPFLEFCQHVHQADMCLFRICRDHDAFADVLAVGFHLRRLRGLPEIDDRARMADAGGHAEQHRRMKFFRDLIRFDREIVGFLTVRRFHDRQMRRFAVQTVVLLVLARSHARIVGGDDDHAAFDAGVSQREQRVGRHVQSDMFHGDDGPAAAKGDADRHFHGHFFIGCPLGTSADFRKMFQNLGRRRSRITRSQFDAGCENAFRQCLVTAQNHFFPCHIVLIIAENTIQ